MSNNTKTANSYTESRFCKYEEIPLILDANDVIRLLGLSRTTVYYMLRAEDFPAITIGTRKLVRREKLFHWLDAHEKDVDKNR